MPRKPLSLAALAAVACILLSHPGEAGAALDSSLFLRQSPHFFERLAALDIRLTSRENADDACPARILGLTGRLAVEYLIDAKNMIAVMKSAQGSIPEITLEEYVRAQLSLFARKLDLDAKTVEETLAVVSEPALRTAGGDLLKNIRQLRDFFLETAAEPQGLPRGTDK